MVNITVKGTGFPTIGSETEFYCVITPTSDYIFGEIVVQATLTSFDGTEILCENIPGSLLPESGNYGAGFMASLRFSYDK